MAFDYTLYRLERQMEREASVARIEWESEKMASPLVRTAGSPREPKERPSTAAKREREFFYGNFNPAKGISECCSMIRAANGTCTGCGE